MIIIIIILLLLFKGTTLYSGFTWDGVYYIAANYKCFEYNPYTLMWGFDASRKLKVPIFIYTMLVVYYNRYGG